MHIGLVYWFGEKCTKRPCSTLEKASLDCLKKWMDPKRDIFICNLLGLDLGITGFTSPIDGLKYLDDLPECQWDGNSIHRELHKELLEKALDFIKNPIE